MSINNQEKERSGVDEHQVKRPQGVGEKDYEGFENKIIDLFNAIKDNLPDYNPQEGPNSNGFVRFLIETTGGGVDLPKTAWKNEEIKKYWEEYKKTLQQKED